jgi:hypothetical protein
MLQTGILHRAHKEIGPCYSISLSLQIEPVLSRAGYTSQNGYGLGRDSYTLPEIVPTGLNVSMNENYVGTIVSENATDGALYRSAVVAGGYYFSQFQIPSNFFINGSNRLDL